MVLKDRLAQFRDVEYEGKKDFYELLEHGQTPHTLFISCSDSRVDSETLLQAKPGEIFHLRNVANIVPREEEPFTHPSVVSAIEYGVKILEVQNVIVCGHSNCGGCKAMTDLDHYKDELPYTHEWVSQSVSIYHYIEEKYKDLSEGEKIVLLEKLNAIQQLDNLMTYDFIKERYEEGKLRLQAYYYNIAQGLVQVYEYDDEYIDIIEDIKKIRKKQI